MEWDLSVIHFITFHDGRAVHLKFFEHSEYL